MLRCWFAAGLLALVLTGSAPADEPIAVKVLYCGEPGSERAADYVKFLESHFSHVAVQNLLTFKEEQATGHDVVVIDWSPVYDAGKGEMNDEKWKTLRKAPPLGANFRRPTILIGGAGGTVIQSARLKIDWLCLCLDGPAHRVAVDHPLFHAPLEVNPEFSEQDTPADYADETVDPTLGKKMSVWRMQTKNFPEVDPGLVSNLYGFADSPDAEVFAQGMAGKGPDTVTLGRHANYFLWGFSASPADMAPAARRLFVNAVCYIRKFDGQSPLVYRTSPGREWALRYALIPRQLTDEGRKRSEQQLREMLPRFLNLLPQEARDDPEAFIAKRVEQSQTAYRGWLKEVIPQPLHDEFGMDVEKYQAYYHENLEYLRPDDEKSQKLVVDDDAKTVGPSNRRPEMLERCVGMLENNDRPELATRLLKRYTSQDFATAGQWRAWLDANKPRLFFSDSGGYKFFAQPASP
ncbi:MAG TPA: hypothetical protein VMF30_12125 [Pirellulales bacterium]|nr:hypothetical protein [Pirellulales bacterium]